MTHLSNRLTRTRPELNDGPRRAGAARHQMRPVLSLGLVLALSACAVPAPVSSVRPAAPADPVLAYVATAQLGLPGEVNAPAYGGTVTVDVQSQYFAASGATCRTYQLSAPGGASRAGLACNDAGAWQNIPPLTSGATVGTPP